MNQMKRRKEKKEKEKENRARPVLLLGKPAVPFNNYDAGAADARRSPAVLGGTGHPTSFPPLPSLPPVYRLGLIPFPSFFPLLWLKRRRLPFVLLFPSIRCQVRVGSSLPSIPFRQTTTPHDGVFRCQSHHALLFPTHTSFILFFLAQGKRVTGNLA
ncbi:hypothetical protein BO86DRAFT_19571 [Aspergillus japonicus CBS 114.51]|uniref:Uncharacterized protein n=1 Tax=Aspergillus japonicus CBS 114.51 TaxID=1448312 RepID=A0A8T8WLB9_ASPJA|nr:hypothetical protein BO86DRAFT_19571 [Aspergillus japonicus CBS 114.51]RAH76310.1 hypothetical protein BO86DRAFT_19571 [Aspergillus japonicus CBS 114.51]